MSLRDLRAEDFHGIADAGGEIGSFFLSCVIAARKKLKTNDAEAILLEVEKMLEEIESRSGL